MQPSSRFLLALVHCFIVVLFLRLTLLCSSTMAATAAPPASKSAHLSGSSGHAAIDILNFSPDCLFGASSPGALDTSLVSAPSFHLQHLSFSFSFTFPFHETAAHEGGGANPCLMDLCAPGFHAVADATMFIQLLAIIFKLLSEGDVHRSCAAMLPLRIVVACDNHLNHHEFSVQLKSSAPSIDPHLSGLPLTPRKKKPLSEPEDCCKHCPTRRRLKVQRSLTGAVVAALSSLGRR